MGYALSPCQAPQRAAPLHVQVDAYTRHPHSKYQVTSVPGVKGHTPPQPDACAHMWLQDCKVSVRSKGTVTGHRAWL